jgi:hypothetical protein
MSIWLCVIDRGELLKKDLLTGIIDECRELYGIFTASVTTVRVIEGEIIGHFVIGHCHCQRWFSSMTNDK